MDDRQDSGTQPGDRRASVYDRLRDDIVLGRVKPHERLKVSEIAARMGSSTNPVREALQQLRGEGFVILEPNRGARVRPMDADFVRDIVEIEMLIEPKLTRWFVGMATAEDIRALDGLCARMEALKLDDDHEAQYEYDTQFHRLMYDRHYNRNAVELWWRHRNILGAIARPFTVSPKRRNDVLAEHRALVDAIRRHDADEAARVIEQHVEGSGRHIVEQMRAMDRSGRARAV
ncbi:GntR family transcriptional regulator [Mangrovicoccus ximenensis]|uniref:GntR family transcriptional regulator n=1 Tax=Mangrovicoccus ximenensis TaxID=1911570 RepID=UPI000D369A34|nr:GntR family transcriptional regulator [Mangrovicoccus ximenensis]